MPDQLQNLSLDNVHAALRGYYSPLKPTGAEISTSALCELLCKLPAMSIDEHVDTIQVQLGKHHPGLHLSPDDFSLIAFVDDAITQILRKTDLDFRVEAYIRDIAPFVAVDALEEEDVRVIAHRKPILKLIDLLISECIGWSEDLGILGDQFIERIDEPVRAMISGRYTLEECLHQLTSVFGKENPIYEKLETRLCDSEMADLASEKGKFHAAMRLNEIMEGKQLPLFIIFMLQGSWYEFMQHVFNAFGPDSKEWKRVGKITEALVWSLMPQTDVDRQRELTVEIPRTIAEFCERMPFDTDETVASMADVEEEHDKIMAGHPSDGCDFDLLDIDESVSETMVSAEQRYLDEVATFDEHQWFLFDDRNEPDEKVARIRLILNWSDTGRLLFTNHNRRKVLHMSYGEMANYLANETIRPLSVGKSAHQIIYEHLYTVVLHVQQQKKKEIQTEEARQRRDMSQVFLAKRKEALAQALMQHRKVAKQKQKRSLLLREKAHKKLESAEQAVAGLRVDAWVKLPIMEGTLTPCKLVAIIPVQDKFIFANRAGIKVGEYTRSQLSHMIVTENSEILDTGAEFENVLTTVVTGLREDKHKSYDELTGDTGT
ncbi:MAG: DUF1631 family protein [Pseudomonadota bacterium]